MILGYALIAFALAATAAASVLFTKGSRAGLAHLTRPARWAALAAAASVVGAAGYLMFLFATHQFQVHYVAEYSAKRAASKYLFAAFWGGQEGSILLWTFWTAIFGGLLAWKAGAKVGKVWPIFGCVQTFLLCLLLLKSPFALGVGPVPLDGRGLNPLLENPWMVIHPPILFVGFASLVVPYAWTVYGLVYRDWDGWVKAAFPWALFAFASLGFGVALGGYWAYETLGWGGFWGWDPVENSSLVPWLFVTALLHGMAIQRANGGYKVSNFVLGFLPFAFMVYGTFLTRTGVLEGFSVHTFSSIGKDGFILLLGGVIASALVPLALIAARFKQIPKPPAYEKVVTREWGFFVASALIGLIALITAVGMSAPLISKIWNPKGSAVQPDFYNQAGYPITLLLAVAMASTPYLAWRATKTDEVLRRLFPAYVAAIALTFGMLAVGARNPWMLLLFAASVFAVVTNLVLIAPRMKRRNTRRTVGGLVAHMGAGLFLAGVACLVAFQQRDEQVLLIKNVPQQRMGFTLTYLGMTSHPFDRQRNFLRVRVERKGKVWEARPRYYFAPWNSQDTLFANPPAIFPNIWNVRSLSDAAALLPWNNPFPWGDLYIAFNRGPFANTEASFPPLNIALSQLETPRVLNGYTFQFRGFDDPDGEAARRGDDAAVGRVMAKLDVTYEGRIATLTPAFGRSKSGDLVSLAASLPGPPGQNVIVFIEQTGLPQGDPTVFLRTEALHPTNNVDLRQLETPRTFNGYTFHFKGLDFPDYVREAAQRGGPTELMKLPELRVMAKIDVTYNGQTTTLLPALSQPKSGGQFSIPVRLPGPAGQNAIALVEQPGIREGKQEMFLRTFNLPDPSEIVQLEVSTKPMIGLVWLGTLLYTTGGFVAYRRRARETGLLGVDEPEADAADAPAPTPAKKTNRAGRLSPEPARATATPKTR